MASALFGPKADEFGFRQNPLRRGRDKVKAMRFLEHAHEMAKIECFACAGFAFKDGKAVHFTAEFLDKTLMPFRAAAAVVKAERFRAEHRFGRQSNSLTVDVVPVLLDQ